MPYDNGARCYVADVNPKKAGYDFEGVPSFASVWEAKQVTKNPAKMCRLLNSVP